MTAIVGHAPAAAIDAQGLVSGALLRVSRLHIGMSQEALAERLGVSWRAYQSWEQGTRPLSHLSVLRFKALGRSLVDMGTPSSLVCALDIAIELDIDIARALASEENLFPPEGCSETWQALLQWALGGRVPVILFGLRNVEPPRICPRDQRILMYRAGWECGG